MRNARTVHGNKYDYSKVEYVNSRTKVCIICPKHGEFWQTANKHLQGSNCPKCAVWNKLTTKTFIKKAIEVHGVFYDYSRVEYNSSGEKVCIICPEHGEYWQEPASHLRGYGCPMCTHNFKLTTKSFIEKSVNLHGTKYDYSNINYINSKTEVCIICPIHGEFWQLPNHHLRGSSCPKCSLGKTQNKIFSWLQKEFPDEKWEWESSPKWLGLQRFDIYNKCCNIAIEYNGEQHYFPVERFGGEEGFKKTIQRDLIKAEKCKNNNCELYVIKYDDIDYDRIKEDITNLINKKKYEN